MTITEDELFKIITDSCGSLKHSSARDLAGIIVVELKKRETTIDKLVADVAKLKRQMKRAVVLPEARWQR